jgi:DNA topoisomerase-1
MHVVVVESPAKAKTINKYLGKDYEVYASFGHVRDLPAKNGSVDPDKDFAMIYEVDDDARKHVSTIASAVKKADSLYLATDPDREGEAISWHVLEALKNSKALPKDIKVHRVTFDEITKKAIVEAFEHPRAIDMNMVNAQQARRALDYLVGFTLSPVLWRKLPGSKSAGRVQSVALRLICERDAEIEKFVSQEYWDIKADMLTTSNAAFTARLINYNNEKLEKFSVVKDAQAKDIVTALKQKQYKVASVEAKEVRRHPAPPFTTSTLQQEAARKLGFGAKRTMQVAQKLYEDGIITYMRTDGVTVSQDALSAARAYIGTLGKDYLPDAPRAYKTKSKNAQEAHEAIRPTDVTNTPQRCGLSGEQRDLYELVWKRMVASQMESAVFDQTTVDINASDNKATFRATGTVIKFDGFLKLYREGRDDEEDENDARLPALNKDESLTAKDIIPEQHFTEPPPRYTEASLVKKLEELGIGRPSTYASIISVLQDRGYVVLDKKRFVAESQGRLVNAFLTNFFTKYVEYDFTADLEAKLDDVSDGEIDWKQVLRDFWNDFIAKIEDSKKLTIEEVLAALNLLLADYVFGPVKDGKDPRKCPVCATGTMGIRVGRFGPFTACSNYPECNHKAQIGKQASGGVDTGDMVFPKILGKDPASGEDISLKKGPYGVYVQIGEGKKPKRAGLLKNMQAAEMDLEKALSLLSLPRELGLHPDTKKPIVANNGRFGPYLLHDGKFTTLPPEEDVLTIGINRAVEVLANAPVKGAGRGGSNFTPLKVLGKHPDDEQQVAIYKGRYGEYVKHGKTNATLPKDANPETYTLEEAIPLLAARAGAGKKKKPTAKKKPAKKKAV